MAAFRRVGDDAALPMSLEESRSTGAAFDALSALSVLARLASSDMIVQRFQTAMVATQIDYRATPGARLNQTAVSTYETDPQGRFTPRLSTHAADADGVELAACNTLAATKMQLGWHQNNT